MASGRKASRRSASCCRHGVVRHPDDPLRQIRFSVGVSAICALKIGVRLPSVLCPFKAHQDFKGLQSSWVVLPVSVAWRPEDPSSFIRNTLSASRQGDRRRVTKLVSRYNPMLVFFLFGTTGQRRDDRQRDARHLVAGTLLHCDSMFVFTRPEF